MNTFRALLSNSGSNRQAVVSGRQRASDRQAVGSGRQRRSNNCQTLSNNGQTVVRNIKRRASDRLAIGKQLLKAATFHVAGSFSESYYRDSVASVVGAS